MTGPHDPAVYLIGMLFYIACPSLLGYWTLNHIRREWPTLRESRVQS